MRLRSADPLDIPLVDINAMATEHDRATMRTALRFSLALKARMAAHEYPIYNSLLPEGGEDADDAALDAFVRAEMRSAMHYSSTCRMAPEHARDILPTRGVDGDDDGDEGVPGGVVDARLRVYGVQGLRVADASVMPRIASAHLAAPTVAIAEKCADMIKEDWLVKLRSDCPEKCNGGLPTGSHSDGEGGYQLRSRLTRSPAKSHE